MEQGREGAKLGREGEEWGQGGCRRGDPASMAHAGSYPLWQQVPCPLPLLGLMSAKSLA